MCIDRMSTRKAFRRGDAVLRWNNGWRSLRFHWQFHARRDRFAVAGLRAPLTGRQQDEHLFHARVPSWI